MQIFRPLQLPTKTLPKSRVYRSFLNSGMNISYRTLPYIPSDKHLRPDLRLAASDPGLRRVSDVVGWFENAVGLSND